MVFQEMVERTRKETFDINIEKTKRRSINIDERGLSKVHSLDAKINPARFSSKRRNLSEHKGTVT